MVVALLALFVGLGGSAYALSKGSVKGRHIAKNAIRGKHIKRNSVRGSDVKNRSLTARDLKRSTFERLRGPRGPRGPQGAQGPRGPEGPPGPVTDPEPYHEVGAPGEPDFSTSWTNTGGNFSTAGFYKDPFDVVHLKGFVEPGPGFAGNVIFQLPPGYRPTAILSLPTTVFDGTVGGAAGSVTINDEGQLAIGDGRREPLLLDGLTFRAGAG